MIEKRQLLDVLNEKEARELVKYTIKLEEQGRWESGLELLRALEAEGAFLINGAPRIDDPEGRRPQEEAQNTGEAITACLATDMDMLEAVCTNVVYYVIQGIKPTRWTECETPGNASARLQEVKGVKTFKKEDEDAQKAREARRRRPPKDYGVERNHYEREMMKRLREEPAVRMALAKELGAKVVGEPPKASGVVCPSCGKKSIWFYIDVDRMTTARCNHQNSCGYWGSLYDLARAIN